MTHTYRMYMTVAELSAAVRTRICIPERELLTTQRTLHSCLAMTHGTISFVPE